MAVDQGQTGAIRQRVEGVLGVGWRYPFRFSAATGGVSRSDQEDLSAGLEHVRQGIEQILATVIGERRMRTKFGSRLQDRLFEPNDELLATDLRSDVAEAIARNEKRVRLIDVQVVQRQTATPRADIMVQFVVLRTFQPGSLVFPFFLEPGKEETV